MAIFAEVRIHVYDIKWKHHNCRF